MCIVFTIFKALENVPQIKIITDNIKASPIIGGLYNNNFIFNIFANLFSAFTAGGKAA